MSNNRKTIEYADANNLETVETTSESSGYPRNLRHVLTFDRITDALNHSDHLQKLGHEVTELSLEKRDGQQLWSRRNGSITHGMCRNSTDGEFYVSVNIHENADEIAFELLFNGAEPENLSDVKRRLQLAEMFSEQVENILSETEDKGQLSATIFYDPDQNYRINYWADAETVGYSYDTHSYMVALMVDFKNND